MKILIERERKTEKRREKREIETERKKRRVRVRVRAERENLTYGSSADPTTFRVLLIERGQRASISELSVCLMCQKLYDG